MDEQGLVSLVGKAEAEMLGQVEFHLADFHDVRVGHEARLRHKH